MARLSVVGVALALVLSGCRGAVPGAAPKTQTPLVPVKVAISDTNLTFTPVLIARAKGLFEAHGLKPDFVDLSGGSTTVEALQSGSLDFAALAGSNVILAHAKGANDVVTVGNISQKMALYMVMRQDVWARLGLSDGTDLVKRMAALKGLTVGITAAGSVTDSMTRLYARKAGLDPARDLKIAAIGGAAALLTALQHGQIDAFQFSPPLPQQAVAEGAGHMLLNAGELPEAGKIVYAAFATNRRLMNQKPDEVRAAVAAIADAIAFAHDQPDETLSLMKQVFPSVQPDILKAAIADLESAWPDGAAMDEGEWQGFERLMQETGDLKGAAPATTEGEMWTAKFLPQRAGH